MEIGNCVGYRKAGRGGVALVSTSGRACVAKKKDLFNSFILTRNRMKQISCTAARHPHILIDTMGSFFFFKEYDG